MKTIDGDESLEKFHIKSMNLRISPFMKIRVRRVGCLTQHVDKSKFPEQFVSEKWHQVRHVTVVEAASCFQSPLNWAKRFFLFFTALRLASRSVEGGEIARRAVQVADWEMEQWGRCGAAAARGRTSFNESLVMKMWKTPAGGHLYTFLVLAQQLKRRPFLL